MTEVLAELSDTIRPISRREFNAWGADGWFDDERVELIDGVIVAMAAEGGPHLKVVMWLTNHVARHLDPDRMVGVSHPYAVSEFSQPVPDLAIVRTADFHAITDAVTAAELVVEVAHSSRRRDLVVKARLYAEAAVPEYWVLDLVQRRLVVHTDPVDGAYRTVEARDVDAMPGNAEVEVLGVTVPLATVFSLTA
ncbi:Uma2 family endonuclease [Euzebya rosea]|uniref:Uma2 family endonuclease n=1 Tax=Euzebya rosea TaxID=2052804 RepID=UPI001300B6E2|nr:Uma2 family endonuclease [Euzebya rosea]